MARYAIIKNDVVINIIVANSLGSRDDAVEILEPGVAIGWSYVDGVFSPPETEPVEPEVATLSADELFRLMLDTEIVAMYDSSLPKVARALGLLSLFHAFGVRMTGAIYSSIINDLTGAVLTTERASEITGIIGGN